MRCPKCGLVNPSTAFRCVSCGHSLAEVRLSELESRLSNLAAQLEEIRTAISALRHAPPEAAEAAKAEFPAPAPPSPVPAPPIPKTAQPATVVVPPAAVPPKGPPKEWEALIGGRWLAKIGTVALVLGVLYFLKYAFDNQWIGNTGRVLIGGFSGLAMLYGGERFQTKGYNLYGQTVAGGGIVVLYLSIYAAFNFYSLISQLPAMLLMALVTAVCCGLAYRYGSRTLATMGLLGGLLTPYLLSTGQSNQIGLLSYLLVLDVGAGWLARKRRWGFLNLISFVGTVIIFAAWAATFYQLEDVWRTHIFLDIFAALYLGLLLDRHSTAGEQGSPDISVTWLLGGIVVFLFFESNVVLFFEEAGRFWPFILVFCALGLAFSLWLRTAPLGLGIYLLSLLGICPWLLAGYQQADRPLTIASLTVLWIMFAMGDLSRLARGLGPTKAGHLALALLNGLIYFGLAYFVLHTDYSGWMGLLAVGVALAHLALANALRSHVHQDSGVRKLILIHIGIAVTLTTLAIPIQLEQDWITIGWGVEALVLTWIGTATASERMRQAGLAVLVLCLIRLLTWTALRPLPEYAVLLNRRFLAFLGVIVVICLIATLYRKTSAGPAVRDDLGLGWSSDLFPPTFVMLAVGIFVIAVSQEAWTYYGHQQGNLSLTLAQERINARDYRRSFQALSDRRQLTLSLVWGLCSILAVVGGLAKRFRPARLFGIGLFVLTIVKVFSVDIWRLEQLYRIISTVALGGLLLGVAFLYQRFKTLIIKA
jgi:uncharacterized membrane protein